jgi:hypothetical protein
LIVRGDHASAMELIDRNPALVAGFFFEIAAPFPPPMLKGIAARHPPQSLSGLD